MKLFYYKEPDGNFGDDLNPWLWNELVPDAFDEDDSTVFFGIGTVINDRLLERAPNAKHIVVFSSGVGYGRKHLANLPKIDSSLKIYCLRGPLSAHVLGASSELAVTDGALLLRKLVDMTGIKKTSQSAYMPHISQAKISGNAWKSLCDRLGIAYIDPRWPRDKVISSIVQTEILMTEAMHGAIVADSLRVPWVPIQTSPKILGFKWWDWCLSIGVEYDPVPLMRLQAEGGICSSVKSWMRERKVANRLLSISKNTKPMLSEDNRIEQLTVQLEEKLQQFKNDINSGYFAAVKSSTKTVQNLCP